MEGWNTEAVVTGIAHVVSRHISIILTKSGGQGEAVIVWLLSVFSNPSRFQF